MKKLLGNLARLSILRFAVIGALGMPVDWSVLQLMVHLGTGPYLGRMVSWFCAASFTWAGNRYFTFAATRARGPAATLKEWGRFLAANAVGGLVNVGLYSVLVRFAPPPFNGLTVALVCGVLLGLVFNFTLSKRIVFKGASVKIVAITGGGAGIGRAIAWHFARAGYGVSITDRDREAGLESLQVMREAGTEALFVPGDVSKPADVTRWLAQTKRKLGVPDLLVNNAGAEIRKDVLKLTIAEFDSVIATNLRGTFLCSQTAARMMAARRRPKDMERGCIINIASTRAFMSEPGTEGYTASKGGIVALTHGMAISLGPHHIRVNAISPGWIETADWQKASKARKPHHSDADRAQHPVGRVGTPEDVAKACRFIAEDAGFMTGQNLMLDGGMTVKMIYV